MSIHKMIKSNIIGEIKFSGAETELAELIRQSWWEWLDMIVLKANVQMGQDRVDKSDQGG